MGDIIRMTVNDQAFPEDLPNLAKSTFYMRQFKYSKDIYMHVHAKAMTMHQNGDVPENIFEMLKLIYTE